MGQNLDNWVRCIESNDTRGLGVANFCKRHRSMEAQANGTIKITSKLSRKCLSTVFVSRSLVARTEFCHSRVHVGNPAYILRMTRR